jgi:hypothetical protein
MIRCEAHLYASRKALSAVPAQRYGRDAPCKRLRASALTVVPQNQVCYINCSGLPNRSRETERHLRPMDGARMADET